jgi:hypothetical protein
MLETLKFPHLTVIFQSTAHMFVTLQVKEKLSMCTSYTEVYNNDLYFFSYLTTIFQLLLFF